VSRLAALLLAACVGCPGSQTGTKLPGDDMNGLDDKLGQRPPLGTPVPYKSVTPETYESAQGIDVWLLERPALPMVSMTLVVPIGSADDPPGKAGLAHITADMLDEGAGDLDAIGISTAFTELGASFFSSAGLDSSRLGLTVLKKHLPKAFPVFAHVVARPWLDAKEWARVSNEWQADLLKRADDPRLVASVVRASVLYGSETPYGHPTMGYVDTAQATTLDDVKAFYKSTWRPDRALLVVAGAITRAELDALLAASLSDWKAPPEPPKPTAQGAPPKSELPKLVLVDRPRAPQSVIAVVRAGVAASDPSAPLLDLVNTALGGSFTSRLNQNLREEHGWTYGAGSSFAETRGIGPFIAQSSVVTEATGPALKEMLAEVSKMAASGPTDDEVAKIRMRDLTDLIQTHETLEGLVGRLATLGSLGLAADFDARASKARQETTRDALATLAKKHLDPAAATVVVVGPKSEVGPQLAELGLGDPVFYTVEGRPQK
jgi:predicted Zn-dependent peptidase